MNDMVEVVEIPGQHTFDTPVDTRNTHQQDQSLDEEQKLLARFVRNMHAGFNWWEDKFAAAREDLAVTYDTLWPSDVRYNRTKKFRPVLEVNYLPQFVNQVIGAGRKSRFAIHVTQKAGVSSVPEDSDMTEADIMEGLIRDIEMRSNAHTAYCRALENAVEGGFGWLRVRTVQTPDSPFEPELVIEHINDQFSVIFDPLAEVDGVQKADWACLSVCMDRTEFNARYTDLAQHPTSFQGGGDYSSGFTNWWNLEEKDSVRVNEYYYKESCEKTAVRMRLNDQPDDLVFYLEDQDDGVMKQLLDEGWVERERKKVDTHEVKFIRCLHDRILEKPQRWLGQAIPIIPVWGRRVNTSHGVQLNSLVRFAHDSARMIAFWMSSAAERVANSPKTPFILTPEQIKDQETSWDQMSTENKPYMLYNAEEGVPPPKREPGATLPTGEIQMINFCKDSLYNSVGLHQTSLGQPSNETSGLAIQKRQTAGDTSVFEFLDNLSIAIRNVGAILCDVIPKLMTNDQVRRIVMPNGDSTSVRLNYELTNPDSSIGTKRIVNRLDNCRFDCSVTTGAAFATMRAELVDTLTALGQADPGLIPILRDIIVANMDFPMSNNIAKRVLKSIDPVLLNDAELESTQRNRTQEPTPQDQVDLAKAQAEQAKAEATQVKARAGIEQQLIRLQADMEKTKAALAKLTQDEIDEIDEKVTDQPDARKAMQQGQER